MNKKNAFFAQKRAIFSQRIHFLLKRGWSILPLFGDRNPNFSKAPALPSWKVFQSRQANDSDVQQWFDSGKVGALGVVMGRISGLAVLDIDTAEADTLFRRACPDLVETMTVRSGNRGLPHYYFGIPTTERIVSSWNVLGADFRAEGTYVVAPGSVIGGKQWTIINDRDPRMLSESDLQRLEAFACLLGRKSPAKPLSVDSGAPVAYSAVDSSAVEISASGLRRRYAQRSPLVGRNNALFEVACYARDHGWSEMDVADALVDVHVSASAPSGHRPQTPRQRATEAAATLSSAYSRPARTPIRQPTDRIVSSWNDWGQMPNSLREALLQHDLDREARVLDALLFAGVRPGAVITPADAYARIGDLGVGRNTVYAALKAELPDGGRLFADAEQVPPPAPPSHSANAATRCAVLTNPCVIGRVAKPGKNRGRPVSAYVMPSIVGLCERLDVSPGYGDRLSAGAFASPASYRAALHEALIRRAPGTYPRAWLAARLGVSADTTRRYDIRAGIEAEPTYQDWSLSFAAIEYVMPDRPSPGQFIEDEKGHRYPPIPDLARKLIGQGKQLIFRVQDANRYRVGRTGNGRCAARNVPTWNDCDLQVTDSMPDSKSESFQHETIQPPSPASKTFQRETIRPDVMPSPAAETVDVLRETFQLGTIGDDDRPIQARAGTVRITRSDADDGRSDGRNVPTWNDWDNVQADAEAAEAIYTALRDRNPARALTRKAAAELVADYGAARVRRALDRVLARADVRSPAGLLKSLLRGECGAKRRPQKSAARAESRESWMAKMSASPYADFIDTGGMTLAEMAAVEF